MLDNRIRGKKICVACGDSAGHIFPGLALAEELTRRYKDVKISFLTSGDRLARSLLAESGFSLHVLPLHRQRRPMRENLKFLSGLLKGTLESVRIIFSERPDCFVGFGSYVAGPPFVAALLLGVPTLIHEQNAVMGRANRIMRRFATKVAISFKEDDNRRGRNVVFTGNPIRESAARTCDKTKALDSLGLEGNKFTILIIGGSQGSRAINSMTIEMLRDMRKGLRDRMQLIHISGEGDYEWVKRAYEDIDIGYRLYPFFRDMGTLYSASDISISRAGASVIYELCMHRIPSILIPYPFAESHQVQNAGFLAQREAAAVIDENRCSKASLLKEVERFIDEKEVRKSMGEKMAALVAFDAAGRLADEVSSLL